MDVDVGVVGRWEEGRRSWKMGERRWDEKDEMGEVG